MIDSGIERLKEIQRKQNDRQTARARETLWNKLFGIIRSIPGTGVDTHNMFCSRLIVMKDINEQRKAILDTYGAICLQKVETLLQQIDSMIR